MVNYSGAVVALTIFREAAVMRAMLLAYSFSHTFRKRLGVRLNGHEAIPLWGL